MLLEIEALTSKKVAASSSSFVFDSRLCGTDEGRVRNGGISLFKCEKGRKGCG